MKEPFFFFISGRLLAISPSSNARIMQYNIPYWWFWLSRSNRWTKYLAHLKIRRSKLYLLIFASLAILVGFYLLLSTQLTHNLTLEWNGRSMFYTLSHIYAKLPFCCVETVANSALNRWRVAVFDRLWANATSTLNTVFSLTNVHAKWWIHCLLISSTSVLSQATSIYDRPKRVGGVFLVFSGTTAEFGWPERSASIVSIRPRL